MYIILVYDIMTDDEGPRVSRNTFKICKKYLTNIQKSVFEGNLRESELMSLESELLKHIRKDKDSVIIFNSRSEKWLEKSFIGKKGDKDSNFI